MTKQPLIPISDKPLDVLYESPSVMIVKKPQGIPVHPETKEESNTLLNRLFQDNRWLADMETSLTAGVLHLFNKQDHGLMLFNKTEDYTETLQTALIDHEITFSYIIHVKEGVKIETPAQDEISLHVKTEQTQAGFTTFNITATEGNTDELRKLLFPDNDKGSIVFYCYAIRLVLPHSGEAHTTSIREEKEIPLVTVYHAPP